jgi:hypothetical protein
LRDLVLLRDFFHSFALSSALFFESLFAIDAEEKTLSWKLKMEVAGGRNGKSRRFVGKGRVKNMGAALSLL